MWKLIKYKDLYVGKSPGKGKGIFTETFISKDTIIEECPFMPLFHGRDMGYNCFTVQYKHLHDPPSQVLLLGFGTLYNHSDTPNVTLILDEEKDVYVITTIKDIESEEELCHSYGDDYFSSRPYLTKV